MLLSEWCADNKELIQTMNNLDQIKKSGNLFEAEYSMASIERAIEYKSYYDGN